MGRYLPSLLIYKALGKPRNIGLRRIQHFVLSGFKDSPHYAVILSFVSLSYLFTMDSADPARAFVKDVKRIIIKVGTAVVTRGDGRLALGRMGSLCEQIRELTSQGFEVILVTSGAVGVGRQRLRYRKLINSSFADLQKPQGDLDGKACAAVGQNGLMALYDTLFSQLDVTSAQLMVTDNDFRDPDFRRQLNETVNSLLCLKVVPIFNENDAISTRKAPYELSLQDSSGIFWDNDSLAALLALELKADLLVLLSDVDGLYTGPPSDPQSELIHTYVKEKHEGLITFGDKSRVGRGGMTAKVKAAVYAAYAGIPVVITSGFANNNIIKALDGECVGTLFHREAIKWASTGDVDAREMAVSARECARRLQALSSQERSKILLDIADALEAKEEEILAENEADVAAAQQAGYEKSLISRLALKPGKISSLANSVRVLANMDEPVGRILKRTELADGIILEKTSSPLGVLLIIFESRPDALVQIASLAVRSGNGLLLKGGKEAKKSNAILHKVITSSIPPSVGEKLIGLVTSREEIPELLKLDDVIDLVIPRGSNKLVSQIKAATKIPVLGHADGICHVFIDKSADLDMAKRIVLDAKTDYPAACNAMETLLVHKDLVQTGGLNDLILELQEKGVSLFGGPKASCVLNIPEANSFHHEYGALACTVEIVEDVNAAIDHIHRHGSAHTDSIITEDKEVAELFLRQVDSAAVLHNASTRFSDGFRFGLGAEVGISTSRIHARGPVGVEGLLTTRWLARGSGQVVDGDKEIVYTHKDLNLEA
ncbi:delta-1-pyrroline-5-carboxylate synthase isoform X1 [Capsicum annuum]|uniref:delta-1-pyrroline-5-carboxylate synthase isoform X1 n=1 Tax=Capsicum annuum TaxID=4072 RepID=UPI001FB06B26|nr:delta-1-pyrroline-5-carboxylate synthase isoform X1 [Capsicum annuum]XP_047270787.1 delta-1-pyrroline-5-carboxylate synthase isoform X1 [Capsicum annuum]